MGGCDVSGMQGRARLEVGARTRTLNMLLMSATLDVSKFSGLLNFFVSCRVAREVIRSKARCGQGGGRAVGGCGVSGMQGDRLEAGRGHAP